MFSLFFFQYCFGYTISFALPCTVWNQIVSFHQKKKKRILVGLWFFHVLLDSLADIAAGLSGIVFKILFSNFLLSLYKIQLIQYIDLISCHLGNLLLTSNNCFVGFFWYFLCKQTYQLKIETVIPVSFQTLYFLLPFFFFDIIH